MAPLICLIPLFLIIVTTRDTEILKVRPRAGLTAQIVSQSLHLWLRTSESQDHSPISPPAFLVHSVLLKTGLKYI